MYKEMIVSSTNLETKLAIVAKDEVTALLIERAKNKGILGNVYKGKVTRVLPGMQAAFVDFGSERHGFLYVGDLQEESELFDEKDAERPRRSRRGRSASKSGPVAESTPPAAEELDHFPETRTRLTGQVLPSQLPVPAVPTDTAPPREKDAGLGILPDRLKGIDPEDRVAKRKSLDQAAIDEGSSRLSLFSRVAHQDKTSRSEKRGGSGKNRKSSNGREASQMQIDKLLKKGQEILVQVAKEPIGRKGARLTSHIAIPGRYLVYMPTVGNVGVSRQIESERERSRLKDIVVRNREEKSRGFIVRTAGEGQPARNIVNDMGYLTRLWSQVRKRSEKLKAPALIHSEPGLVERTIRDRFTDDFRAVRVDSEDMYHRVVEFVSAFNPDFVEKVRLHTKARPILDAYRVTPEIENALKSKVWLRNGAYIVINQTEALVAIDVNSGKYVGKTSSLEDTITQVNIDSVGEIVRQIRLRGLGGIIILDFIDMEESSNRRKVLDALHRELARDNVPSRILRFNEFGLVAITRKRDRSSLEKTLCQPCFYCEGRGMNRSLRTIAYSIQEDVRKHYGHYGEGRELFIRCHPQVAETLREDEPEVLEEIEAMTRKKVSIQADPLLHIERFSIMES